MAYEHDYLHNIDISKDSVAQLYYDYFNGDPMDIDSAQALVSDADNIVLDKDRVNDLIEIINRLQQVKIETETELNQWLRNMGDATYPNWSSAETYYAGEIVRDGDGDYLYMCRYDSTSDNPSPMSNPDEWILVSTNTLGINWGEDVTTERKVGSTTYLIGGEAVGKVDIPLEADDAYTEIDNGVTYYHLDGNVLTFMQNDDSGNTYELYPTIKAENVTTDMSSVTSLTSFGANLAETLIRDYQTVKFK